MPTRGVLGARAFQHILFNLQSRLTPSPRVARSAIAAFAILAAVPATAQDVQSETTAEEQQRAQPAARASSDQENGAESSADPDGRIERLPTVTVETTDEPEASDDAKAKRNSAENQNAPRRQSSNKTAKAKTPASEEADPSLGAATAEETSEAQSARGGPTQIDGYIAKQTTTATKTATPVKDIPQSVSIMTAEQARDQGSQSVGKALTYVPGVTVSQGEGQRDQITIRGQVTTSDFFVDGVRDDVEYFRDLYNVESIEVVKGPNAMIFGRGGSGGVVNRSTKQADGRTIRNATIVTGMFDTKRATIDVGQALSSEAAFRLNAMYEDSGSHRDFFELERFGINPTAAFELTDQTNLLLSYEFYKDDRIVDRGVPSRNGRPLEGFRDVFFGNPDLSVANYVGHRLSAILEHSFSEQFKVRSATVYADGDKAYQNAFAASSVDAAGNFTINGYRDTMDRQTLINQTDWTYRFPIADGIRNTLLFGTELTHQENENFRDVADGAVAANIASPTIFGPNPAIGVPNRRRDATLNSAGTYIQTQLEISRYVELIGGMRFDHYDVDFNDALVAGSAYTRRDNVWSPRAGVVFKPTEALSVYLTYSKAFVPSVADQLNFVSIGSGVNRKSGAELDPEEFENKEIGFKWELTPRLMLTGALFQIDRSNTAVVTGSGGVEQIGATRTEGGELAITGQITDQWQIAAAFAHQIAVITDGAASTIGNDVASVPHNTLSVWNKYMLSPDFGVGVGVVHRTSFFASGDNAVEVDGYTRLDGALYFGIDEHWSAQVNVENILNEDYFVSAHNNTNISPGAPTTVFVTLGAQF